MRRTVESYVQNYKNVKNVFRPSRIPSGANASKLSNRTKVSNQSNQTKDSEASANTQADQQTLSKYSNTKEQSLLQSNFKIVDNNEGRLTTHAGTTTEPQDFENKVSSECFDQTQIKQFVEDHCRGKENI